MAETIAVIKEKFQQTDREGWNLLLEQYKEDNRQGVQNIIKKYTREQEKYQQELIRTEHMYTYEKKYQECRYICGIDEVGRGPLAGPVVACAVMLPKEEKILYLNDSKQLSAAKREELCEIIKEKALGIGIGIVEPEEIDKLNILQATYKAMRMAISKLPHEPEILLNDAVIIPEVDIEQMGIIKGDTKSASIAAASIVAKVTRDQMMVEYDKEYPGYGFASNKGYGSKEHVEALKKMRPTQIHRRSFIKNIETE